MKTTNQLLTEIKDKSVFFLVWSIFWRGLLVYAAVTFTLGFIIGLAGV